MKIKDIEVENSAEVDLVSPELIGELQKKLQEEQDGRKEDRFIFSLALLILFNIAVFSNVENWAGSLVIGVLQLIGLIILARRFGVQEVSTIIDRLLDWNK